MAYLRLFKQSDRKGFWYIDYFDPEFNRRIRKNLKTADKRTAESILSEIRNGLAYKEAGLFVPNQIKKKDKALQIFFSEYLKYVETRLSKESIKRYRTVIENFLEFLNLKYSKIKRISELNSKVFDDFQTYRRNEKYITINGKIASTNTVNYEIKTLRTMFNQAIRWDWIHDVCLKLSRETGQ